MAGAAKQSANPTDQEIVGAYFANVRTYENPSVLQLCICLLHAANDLRLSWKRGVASAEERLLRERKGRFRQACY